MIESVVSNFIPEVSITDDSFDLRQAHRYRLLLQINDDGAIFAVLNHQDNKFVFLRDYKFDKADAIQKLEEILSSGEYFSKIKYKSVSVSITTPLTTLVPSPLFDINDSRKLLEFNHVIKSTDQVYSNLIRTFDVYNVFAVPGPLAELLKATFGDYAMLHSATTLMEGVHIEYRSQALPGLFINVRKRTFELMAANGKQLLFYNNFRYESPEDFIYYVLFATEQLRLNPELNPLMLSGNIQEEDTQYAMLYKYFRRVNFVDLPEQFSYHYGIEQLSSHTYFSVFSQVLCES